jgi:hypothetical protein
MRVELLVFFLCVSPWKSTAAARRRDQLQAAATVAGPGQCKRLPSWARRELSVSSEQRQEVSSFCPTGVLLLTARPHSAAKKFHSTPVPKLRANQPHFPPT